MSDPVIVELVVSSWPFRLGTLVFDPMIRVDLMKLRALASTASIDQWMTDPEEPYQRRVDGLIDVVNQNPAALRSAYDIDPHDDAVFEARPSDIVVREVNRTLEPYGLAFEDVQLPVLDETLKRLDRMSIEQHHAIALDWYEAFDLSPTVERPSTFRARSATQVYGNSASALDQFEKDFEFDSGSDFSLWTVLRAHYARRLEFPDEPFTLDRFLNYRQLSVARDR